MKTLLIFVGLALCAALMCGCEWTSGGNVDAWNTSQFGTNLTDFSGSYRAADGGVLVRRFGGSVTNTSTNQVTAELIGAGDGSKTYFSGILAASPTRGTLTIEVGSYRFTDSGSGSGTNASGTVSLSVTPADGSAGTVNFGTHAWTLSFPAPIASGTPIQANYYYLETTVSPLQGNHGNAIYSIVVYQTGNVLQLVDSNNSRYNGNIGTGSPAQFSATGTSQGYNVTIVGMLQVSGAVGATTRSMSATFIEEGGYDADIKGVTQ